MCVEYNLTVNCALIKNGVITIKITCIVQARMGSERLPGKVIKKVLDKPMIITVLDRLKKSKYIDDIVLATSISEKEEVLVDKCEQYNYKVFRGSEADVLERYKEAADIYNKEKDGIIIRVTGDCPLIDAVILDNVVTNFICNDYDYVRLDVPETFVRGFDVEVFSKAALNKAYYAVHENYKGISKEEIDMYKEHVTLYMYRNPDRFKIGYVKGSSFYKKNYRLCVDTEDDFKLISEIYNHFKDEVVSSKDVIKFLDNNKELASINSDVKQKKVCK